MPSSTACNHAATERSSSVCAVASTSRIALIVAPSAESIDCVTSNSAIPFGDWSPATSPATLGRTLS
jgi:hypothetical protein